MENGISGDFGRLLHLPYEEFRRRYDEIDYGDLDPQRPTIGDWCQIRQAISRDGLFVIETSTPSTNMRLKFCLGHPDKGDYEIRRRHDIEKGRILLSKDVPPDDLRNHLFSNLVGFKFRFFVKTKNNVRPGNESAWIVGLRKFQNFDAMGNEI